MQKFEKNYLRDKSADQHIEKYNKERNKAILDKKMMK